MSLQVLVVPEDPTVNGAILRPLFERMLRECGRPNAKVTVLTSPRVRGIGHLRGEFPGILERYGWMDLILVAVDADGEDRSGVCGSLEARGRDAGKAVFACAAVEEEVETWLLAGHADKLGEAWPEVRRNRRVKEEVFFPFLAVHGDARMPAGGREELMNDGLRNYRGILQRCPELAELEARLRAHVEGGS